MVKTLQRIGNSSGLIIDKTMLALLEATEHSSFNIEIKDGGLFLKPLNIAEIYEAKAKKHRKSLDKLGK